MNQRNKWTSFGPIILLTFIGTLGSFGQEPTIERIWDSFEAKAPESTLHFEIGGSGVVFVSSVLNGGWSAGDPNHRGYITILRDQDGSTYERHQNEAQNPEKWFTHPQLDSPKGMAIDPKRMVLYVSDIDQIFAIRFDNRLQVVDSAKIDVPGSVTLNDITLGDNGRIFISDTKGGRIYTALPTDHSPGVGFDEEQATILAEDDFASSLEQLSTYASPNGLSWDATNKRLYVAAWGNFNARLALGDWVSPSGLRGGVYYLDLTDIENPGQPKWITKKNLGNLDGLVTIPRIKESDPEVWIISDWITGDLYAFTADSEKVIRLNDMEMPRAQNPADIGAGLVRGKPVLFVPDMHPEEDGFNYFVGAYSLTPVKNYFLKK